MRLLLVSTLVCSCLMAQPAATKGAAKGAATSKGTGSAAAKGPAKTSTATSPALLNPAANKAKAPEIFKAQFTTTKGDFIVEVHRDWAPVGADRFYNLVKIGYFSDIAFFRDVSGFMVQFGIHG